MTRHVPISPILWQGLVLRGTALVCVASLLLTWPQGISLFMVTSSAIAFLALGAFDVVHFAVLPALMRRRWTGAISGVLGICLGAALLAFPLVPSRIIGTLLAGWMIVQAPGIVQLAAFLPARIRRPLHGAAALYLSLGLAVLLWPAATLTALLYLAFGYGFLVGMFDVGLGLRLRARQDSHQARQPAVTAPRALDGAESLSPFARVAERAP